MQTELEFINTVVQACIYLHNLLLLHNPKSFAEEGMFSVCCDKNQESWILSTNQKEIANLSTHQEQIAVIATPGTS